MTFVHPDQWIPSPGIILTGNSKTIITSEHHTAVIAGPGSGKTEILAQRAAYLMTTGTCPPNKNILAISFKVDAASNIRKRVKERCDTHHMARFDSMTIHAFAKRIVDQFREALPIYIRPPAEYNIMFTDRNYLDVFKRDMNELHQTLGRRAQAADFQALVTSIPVSFRPDSLGLDRLKYEFWSAVMRTGNLTFDMIITLACHILESKDAIRAILQQSYSHVFLDEFQDVTMAQYSLIRIAFLGSHSTLTAVGDSQQAIMRWAGAPERIFDMLHEDFIVENQVLNINYRSNHAIVALINSLAKSLFDDAIECECARADDPAPDNSILAWVCDNRNNEAAYMAKFIATSIQDDPNLFQHDFAILTKNLANSVEERLSDAFLEQNLYLRNEARNIAGVAIQDLISDDVVLFIISLMKLTVNLREGRPLQVCQDFISKTTGYDLSNDKEYAKVMETVRILIGDLKLELGNSAPIDVPSDAIKSCILKTVTLDTIKKAFPEYQSGTRLNDIMSGLVGFLDECGEEAKDWQHLIRAFEGDGQVRLMTVHKSKGLEFHTIIFTELNDDAFWGKDDEKQLFFVAMSRACEKLRFSFVSGEKKGTTRRNIGRFIKLLSDAGVPGHNLT